MRRRIAVLLVLVTVAGLLQGCWNYREVDSFSIVAGFAVDRGYEGRKYHLTVDLADTSSAGKDKPVVTKLIETEGDTIFDAIRNVMKKTGLKLYWADCQVGIISQAVAEESILPVVDFLMRDAEPRLTMELFISQEATAKEVLKQQPATLSITSFEIDKMYELSQKYEPHTNYQVLYQIYNTLAEDGRALTLPVLHLVDNMGQKTAELNGIAVFEGDRLLGYISADDTMYMLFAMDKIQGGVINVKAATDNTIASLEIFGNKTAIKVKAQNGKVSLSVKTSTDAAIDELDTTMDYTHADTAGMLQALAETQLKDHITKTIKMIQQQLGRDVFGYCDILHKSDRASWYQLKQNWDDVFKTMDIEVTCKINIRNSTTENSPVKVGN